MGHFFELVFEAIFGLAKETPDKMPDDIIYNPNFTVRHPKKKTFARMVASIIVAGVFSLGCIFVDIDTQILYILFAVLFSIVFLLSLIEFSFRCYVTEQYIKKNCWGLSCKYIEWSEVLCIRVVDKTDEKCVMIAIYNSHGKCIIDLNTDMDNAWYVVKMAEAKNITVKHEKDLSLKQISHL